MLKSLPMLLLCLIVSGCAGGHIYSRLDRNLASGDCAAAMALFDAGDGAYGRNERLLFLLDAAMVTMQCGDFDAAQSNFRKAEDLAERLWTESLSRSALSLVANDSVLVYAGEDFERVMIHLMSAIGYLQAGQPDDALVEARRLDTLLAVYNDKYEKKNVYKEDAFARYLSGILHEADGAWDEAFIDYRRAVEVYQGDYRAYGTDPPEMLMRDMLRAARVVDRMEDVERLLPDDRIQAWAPPSDPPDHGSVVLITFAGYAPRKIQDQVVIPSPHGPIGVAFPQMVVTPPRCSSGRLNVYDRGRSFEMDLVLVEDINRIAVKNLYDRKGRILTKAIARTMAKQAAIYSIARSGNDRDEQRAIQAILNLVNILLVERADTRSWRTLPGQIFMVRLNVPAGDYQAELETCGGNVTDLGPLSVDPRSTRYLFRDLRFPLPVTVESE